MQQCVLVTDVRFLMAEQSLWLDNLYVSYSATNRTKQASLVDCFSGACQLWLTSVTLHGDLSGFAADDDDVIGAVAVVGGQLYAEGVGFKFLYSHDGFCTLLWK
jgi:hypothetical protein